MITADLEREFSAAIAALSDHQREDLVRAGVDRVDIALDMVGVAYGDPKRYLFNPHPDGLLAYCTPIRCHCALTIEAPDPASAVRTGDLVDIVYWHPAAPRRWALRIGIADCLGLIPPQYCDPEPVTIRRGVLDWFRAGCNGLVVLSAEPWDVYRLLTQCVGKIYAEDARQAGELRVALEYPWRRPEVLVRRKLHGA